MTRFAPWLFAITLLVPLSACKKTDAETTPPGDGEGHEHGEGHDDKHGDFEGREVVNNWDAKTGDVTVCPKSGKKFEVTDDSDRLDYKGHSFVFCCSNCFDAVSAEPGKYLDTLVEEAGGPADAAAEGATEEGATEEGATETAPSDG